VNCKYWRFYWGGLADTMLPSPNTISHSAKLIDILIIHRRKFRTPSRTQTSVGSWGICHTMHWMPEEVYACPQKSTFDSILSVNVFQHHCRHCGN
jgi:hypothetical protein